MKPPDLSPVGVGVVCLMTGGGIRGIAAVGRLAEVRLEAEEVSWLNVEVRLCG
jgi:hypothetical protein